MSLDIQEESGFKYVQEGEGEGESLILLHGLFGALSNFHDVIDHFKSRFTVIVPLLPIYDLPVLDTNVKSLSKFLKKFMDFKGIEQANLLGNSLGGHVALVFSKRNPERNPEDKSGKEIRKKNPQHEFGRDILVREI